ncbi:hypothetical protein [Thermostaphylospora chromogena]|uniref:Uncharacterized protein n=1 Tax=Thermostaphylospora chromogena TaxID=35622 RepID=A0A1H1ADM0_9ACTN|nr:hypothetical protein [Thermostaphylospora chromogena]SDQ37805.1 hypothetical protein SAMN04489764_0446 [Thermostaphylospora chromogena]
MAADDRLTGDLEEDVARRLREAHRRVRVLAADSERKTRLARRLVTISDAAKRDLAVAAARLSRFMEDLDALESGASRGQNIAGGD